MALSAATATGHATYWAEALFGCLQEMASCRTNAALLALAGVERLERGCRYPESGLMFAGNGWRAFYHCHDASSKAADEHGHFHIFTAVGKQSWAHVAGLSIDIMGQPLEWFAVNRWVTGGPWLASGQLWQRLTTAIDSETDALAGRWLLALLQLDRSGLAELLTQRDSRVELHAGGGYAAKVLGDRSLYTLATRGIDLQSLLENAFVHPTTAVSGCRHA